MRPDTPPGPTPGQLVWQEAGFGLFLHFGGVRRWHAFAPVTSDRLTVRFSGPGDALVAAVAAFHTGHPEIPRL